MRCNITGPINCRISWISFRPAAIRNGIPKAAAMLYNKLGLYYSIWKQRILCLLSFIPFFRYTMKNWFRLITFTKLYTFTYYYDNWGKSSWLRVLLLPKESKGLSHKKRILEKNPAFSSKLSWLTLLTQTDLYYILTPSLIWHCYQEYNFMSFKPTPKKLPIFHAIVLWKT